MWSERTHQSPEIRIRLRTSRRGGGHRTQPSLHCPAVMDPKAVCLALLAWLMTAEAWVRYHNLCRHSEKTNTTVYDFSLYDVHKKDLVSLNRFRGQVLLIINVASF